MLAGVVAAPLALAGETAAVGGQAAAIAKAKAEVATYAERLPASELAPPVGVDSDCFAPQQRIDPQVNGNGTPTNPAWIERDALNQYCATLRLRDQYDSPAFGYGNNTVGAQLYLDQAEEQAANGPDHIHGGFTTLIPGSQAADPFRALDAWQHLTGGRAIAVSFPSSDGAVLRGHVFLPPAKDKEPAGGYPGVVITDGSIQAFENLYYWAAEDLAQYGYEVMTYDVQGQGDSDLLPASCSPSSCTGVPYQQNYNFYQGAEDSLSFFDSAKNPGFKALDTKQLGIAGHSLGASAVSWIGQCDNRVKSIVAWDDLAPIDVSKCAANVTIPRKYAATKLHAPALATTNDYEFNVQPATSVPDPHGGSNAGGLDGDSGYASLAKAGLDSEVVSFRNGTHLTYTYIPYTFIANELGERFAFYYTLAWFDEYLRGGNDPYTSQSAFSRLTSLKTYDTSSDKNTVGAVSIGAGVYDPAKAAANPTDPEAGNVPYTIAGIPIANSLSFYYYSEWHLTNPSTHQLTTCTDIVARCPKIAPATP
jgi:dienelactone hydrolase